MQGWRCFYIMGCNATGAYLEVRVRRFKGNQRFPEFGPELEWLMKHRQVPGSALNTMYSEWEDSIYAGWEPMSVSHNIVTNSGRDYIHNQAYISPAATTVFRNAAVSADAGAPSAADLTLAAEITTSDLARVSSVTGNSHTAGTNTTTIGITWTSANTYTALQKAALFTLSAAGIMAHEATFSSTSLASGDQLALTWTITLG
jgi:hypothetical protein